MTECRPAGAAPDHGGACAAIRYWWLRNDPPNAAWKKWSAMTYRGALAVWRYS
jgi:hypothetical protein